MTYRAEKNPQDVADFLISLTGRNIGINFQYIDLLYLFFQYFFGIRF